MMQLVTWFTFLKAMLISLGDILYHITSHDGLRANKQPTNANSIRTWLVNASQYQCQVSAEQCSIIYVIFKKILWWNYRVNRSRDSGNIKFTNRGWIILIFENPFSIFASSTDQHKSPSAHPVQPGKTSWVYFLFSLSCFLFNSVYKLCDRKKSTFSDYFKLLARLARVTTVLERLTVSFQCFRDKRLLSIITKPAVASYGSAKNQMKIKQNITLFLRFIIYYVVAVS